MTKLQKEIAGWFLYIILSILLIGSLPKILVFALDSQYPVASIASSSMWPELKQGDLVFIRGAGEIRVGDIVVYQSKKGFTIHRILKIEGEKITTKGDANSSPDAPIKYDQIVGKTVNYAGKPMRIPYLGQISILLKGKAENF